MRPSSVRLGFISLPYGLRVVCRHSLLLFRLGEAAKFDSENRFRVGCGEGREQEAEEELERERRNAVAMAEHGGELAAEEPMKLASGFRIESNYRACTIPYTFPSDSPRKPTPTELSCFDLFYNSTPSFK
ncbi:hypothetical protein C1H46_011125 [Malus baccata]|uniref:Uncharacterized protein n=1 Tax=Malus baccata TaxID=106549 RepID=A0A540MWQ5_MALBA|nr:hypothetical protein C1H46_011125 [Malus baccata]